MWKNLFSINISGPKWVSGGGTSESSVQALEHVEQVVDALHVQEPHVCVAGLTADGVVLGRVILRSAKLLLLTPDLLTPVCQYGVVCCPPQSSRNPHQAVNLSWDNITLQEAVGVAGGQGWGVVVGGTST